MLSTDIIIFLFIVHKEGKLGFSDHSKFVNVYKLMLQAICL